MSGAKMVQLLKSLLFSPGYDQIFTVLDGASVPDLPEMLRSFNVEHICLYRGELPPDMAEVAPYLCSLRQKSHFVQHLLSQGWGRHWGIFGASEVDLRTLATHFRKFLMLCDENGKEVYFRFYDPRVWRTFLSTCVADELEEFFGPVLAYFLEGNEPKMGRKFTLVQGRLSVEAFSVD